MPFAPGPPPRHVWLLLNALGAPGACAGLDLNDWDLLVRTARSARLLGTLAARLEADGLLDRMPEAVARHLRAALAEARYLRQMSLFQLGELAHALAPLSVSLIALKGSAYILAGLRCAAGRLPLDVDLMVERHRLDEVERALLAAGWAFSKTEEYDQRYYREWSHELPPMTAPVLPLELDLHHSILPPIGRLRPDAARLVADSVALPGTRYRVLQPADQLLHAAVHLFQDSDCTDKLRDLVDIDALACEFSAQAGEAFWRRLFDSAGVHGLQRPLWYAVAFSRAWLGTPVPRDFESELRRFAPAAASRALVLGSVAKVLAPVHPDCEPTIGRRLASAGLEFRALFLRMPPRTLAYHAASKVFRGLRRSSAPRST